MPKPSEQRYGEESENDGLKYKVPSCKNLWGKVKDGYVNRPQVLLMELHIAYVLNSFSQG